MVELVVAFVENFGSILIYKENNKLNNSRSAEFFILY